VTGVIYFGDHLRLMCRVADDQADAVVKLALSGTAAPPRAGDDAWLELPAEMTRIYTA
jgi:putative spermidine/putrescine transport system ATP-binding protein